MTTPQKTVAFFGASTGVGLSALRYSLAGGCRCIALCRDPSKLTTVLSPETTPNLEVVQGNAHDAAAVARCLRTADGGLVDAVVFTIGARFVASKMTLEDPHVCERGIEAVLKAMTEIRQQLGPGAKQSKTPHVIVCSTTGISRLGRDTPLAFVPLYSLGLKVPHADKLAMEDKLVKAATGSNGETEYTYTMVRPSLLVDGETERAVRVGVEDPAAGTRESRAIGYTISREDTGKWVAQNLVLNTNPAYLGKAVTITY